MNEIAIIGSGSRLYQNLKQQLPKNSFSIVEEYRTSQLLNGKIDFSNDRVYLIFSMLGSKEIEKYLDEKCQCIFIGSCAALSKIYSRFTYSKLKNDQLRFCQRVENFKYLIFGDFNCEPRIGLQYHSDLSNFWNCVLYSIKSENNIIECYEIKGSETMFSKLLSMLEIQLSPISTLLIRSLTNYSYGYSNAKLKK